MHFYNSLQNYTKHKILDELAKKNIANVVK